MQRYVSASIPIFYVKRHTARVTEEMNVIIHVCKKCWVLYLIGQEHFQMRYHQLRFLSCAREHIKSLSGSRPLQFPFYFILFYGHRQWCIAYYS